VCLQLYLIVVVFGFECLVGVVWFVWALGLRGWVWWGVNIKILVWVGVYGLT